MPQPEEDKNYFLSVLLIQIDTGLQSNIFFKINEYLLIKWWNNKEKDMIYTLPFKSLQINTFFSKD